MAYIKRAVEDTIARVSKMFPVLIDEIQYATELLPVDEKNWYVPVWLISSVFCRRKAIFPFYLSIRVKIYILSIITVKN